MEMPQLTLVTVLVLMTSAAAADTASSSIRYDYTNFTDLISGDFQALHYFDIDPVYKVALPPNGPEDGGAFLLDSDSFECMKPISVAVRRNLTIRVSAWCDPEDSELLIQTKCNYYSREILCEGTLLPERNGKWHETVWIQECLPMENVSFVS